ncbi:MAG: T9SS type A sorting domain-containing protein, partial [Candidatus Thermochlorobacter sp.]
QILWCYDNQLTGALNLSANTALTDLRCQNNIIPIILTDNDGLGSITKDPLTQVAVFRNNSTTPAVPTAQTGAFVLGTTGAIVNFTTGSDDAGDLNASSGTNPNIVLPLPTGIDRISPDKFWIINQSGLSNFTYNLILDLRTISGITAFNLLKVLKRDNNTQPWQDVAQAPISATVQYMPPFILINGLTSFSDFSIGAGGSDNPLPVELSAFTANSTANGVHLFWQTASERNNAGFIVLRNGQEIASYQFSPELRGKGTTSNTTHYTFLDANVEIGKTYTYRLRSVDFDGTVHDYAQSVSVEVRETVAARVFEYKLEQNYPNPFNPATNIKYSIRSAGLVSLKVYDLLGREVATLVNQVQQPGEYQVTFNASNLTASGMYIYRLQAGNFTRTMKMMVVK